MGKFLNLLFYFAFSVNLINLCSCQDEHNCVDKNCQEVISIAKTLKDYRADNSDKLSFSANQVVEVYAKPKDAKVKLWYVKINGKSGYAPTDFLKENSIKINSKKLVTVPYKPKKQEISEGNESPDIKGSIPLDTGEATTTAPLPSNPENLVVSSESNENQSQIADISPVQGEGEVVDGTELPAEYFQGNLEDESKIRTSSNTVQDNAEGAHLNENLTGNSIVGILNGKYAPQHEYTEKSKQERQHPIQSENESKLEVKNNNLINETEVNLEVDSKKADQPFTDNAENSKNSANSSVNPKSLESSKQESNENVNPGENSGNLQKNEIDKANGNKVEQENKKDGAVEILQNNQSELEKISKKDENIYNTNTPNFELNSSESLKNTTEHHSNFSVEVKKQKNNETIDDSEISESVANEKSTEIQGKTHKEKISTNLDPFFAVQLKENDKVANNKAKESMPEIKKETERKIDSDTSNPNVKGSGGSQSDEIKTNIDAKDAKEYMNITHDEVKPESQKIDSEENQNKSVEPELDASAKSISKPGIQKEPITLKQVNSTLSDTIVNTNTEIQQDPSSLENEKRAIDMDQNDSVIPDPKARTNTKVQQDPSSLGNKNKPIDIDQNDATLPVSKIDTETTDAVQDPASLGNQKKAEVNQDDLTDPKVSSNTNVLQDSVSLEKQKEIEVNQEQEDVKTPPYFGIQSTENKANGDVSSGPTFKTSSPPALGFMDNSSQEAQSGEITSDKENALSTDSQLISSEAEDSTETKNEPNVNGFENSKQPNVGNDISSEKDGENHQAIKELPYVDEKEESDGYESLGNIKKADDAEISRNMPEDRIIAETVKNNWFFSNVFETVNNFWSTLSKSEQNVEENFDDDLHKILFPNKERSEVAGDKGVQQVASSANGYCEKVSPNTCPGEKNKHHGAISPHNHNSNSLHSVCSSERDFFSSLSDKVLEMVDLLACLLITALTALLFAFGYYCICHSRKESVLLSKLNIVERSLLVSNKEAAILKHDLIETRGKLTSIEDNSFGSNDMVMALKKELQDSEELKLTLQDQVASLEKELENAAEAGLELNKIVSELLNNQSGDDSIISSVEDLQKQLNEQQNTILQINTTLAEKSRENSELQLILTNQAAKYQEEIQALKQQKEEFQRNKTVLETEFEESKHLLQEEKSKAIQEKHLQIQSLNKELSAFRDKYDDIYRKLQMREARVQILEECLHGVKNNAKFNIKELIDAVNLKTEVLAIKREKDSLKERLEGEMDARKLLDDHIKVISEEVSKLKLEYNQSEKEKVEAKTRLEVLSSYFKEKETQLQKELSLKEAMWLKQQGETSSTVERVRLMQDEIQGLKSQNDSLRAEIEAQAATHKAQIANLENRAHETWLTARQSERKLEEARIEATALRRKLTSIAGNPLPNETNSQTRLQNSIDGLSNDVNNAPSPVHMDTPGSPLLGGLPPPLPFLPPPPFMAHPHQFMPIPPPFMPPGEMRPPPLGRLMSPPPPPPPDRYSPSLVDERDRYSPKNGRYSPDSRYNYNTDIMSNYDTETDFSPPPSPGTRPGGGNGVGYSSRERDRDRGRERNRGYKPFSPPPPNNSDRNKKSKGILSSGSADSYDSRKSRGKGKV